MRAKLNIDERSDAVKNATEVRAETNTTLEKTLNEQGLEAKEVYITTQLVKRELLADGSQREYYATTAITRASFTASNSETEHSVTVYAMVNYSPRVVGGAMVECKLDNTQHRAVYPSAVSTSNMQLTNKVDNGLEILYSNSRNIATPSNGTWYTLSSPTSNYFNLSHKFQATTTLTASNGAAPFVLCEVNLHTALS